MNIEKIKQAVRGGLVVHWRSTGYTVTNHGDQWLVCHSNGSCQGLTHVDGVNWEFGDGSEFFIGDHLQFSHSLHHSSYVGEQWCQDFLDSHGHVRIDGRNGIQCLIVGDVDEPQWTPSELRRMNKPELRAIADRLGLGSVYWEPLKQNLIDELEGITKGEYEKLLFDEQGFYDYDADFSFSGYCKSSGRAKVKVIGAYPYITADYLRNVFFDQPVIGTVEITSTLGTASYSIDAADLCGDYYHWDKEKAIEALARDNPAKIGHDQLIQWAKDNLPEELSHE